MEGRAKRGRSLIPLALPQIGTIFGESGLPELPLMYPVRQSFPDEEVGNAALALEDGLNRISGFSFKGKTIAITAGSRGIKGIGEVLRQTVSYLRKREAEVFIIPAMGSHGGGTAEGQKDVLTKLGLTETFLGAPIYSSMEVVSLGTTKNGLEVFCDHRAYQADGIVVCNRIKAHNVYKAEYESGLIKMLVIGLGKHKGAIVAHNLGFDRFNEILPAAAELSLANAPVIAGIGIIENAYGKMAALEVLKPEEFLEKEPALLSRAKQIMGRLLMDEIDVLIIDEIGKDFSGGGLDANVTGRSPVGLPGFSALPIGRIIVRDLSQATGGNATGIGMADFTTRRCVEKIDLVKTYTNTLTAQALLSPKIPVIAENDKEALTYALNTIRGGLKQQPKIVRIKNTKDLGQVWMSQRYADHIGQNPALDIIGDPIRLGFNESGELV